MLWHWFHLQPWLTSTYFIWTFISLSLSKIWFSQKTTENSDTGHSWAGRDCVRGLTYIQITHLQFRQQTSGIKPSAFSVGSCAPHLGQYFHPTRNFNFDSNTSECGLLFFLLEVMPTLYCENNITEACSIIIMQLWFSHEVATLSNRVIRLIQLPHILWEAICVV